MKKNDNSLSEKTIGVVDLFCGVGGLTYGLTQAGLDVVAGYDLDPSCAYAYSHNNKAQFIEKSVEDIKGKDIRKLLKGYKIKVLVGCAPCQPFSRHQKDKKNRSKHSEWGLLYEFARLIEEAKPHIVSMENVPELINEKVFDDFLQTLKSKKYNVYYRVVDASDFGVPQRRKRLILLASKMKKIRLIDKTYEDPITVRQAIGQLQEIEAGQCSNDDPLHQAAALSALNLERIQHSTPGGTWRDWPEHLQLECHKKGTGQTYGSVYGRMRWDDVAPTITTQFTNYGTGRFGHPEQDRAISLREGALLQSFPEQYKFVKDDDSPTIKNISKHIGNAVPPKLGEAIGISIIEHSKKRPYRKEAQL